MNKSYKLKLEETLDKGILTVDIILSCIAKNEKKIDKLAYKKKKYINPYYTIQMDYGELLAYRKPFIDTLMCEYNLSLAAIKEMVSDVPEQNIPTKAVCDRVREMIITNDYELH